MVDGNMKLKRGTSNGTELAVSSPGSSDMPLDMGLNSVDMILVCSMRVCALVEPYYEYKRTRRME